MVVRETCEFGSLVAADRAGIAQLEVAIGMGQIGTGALAAEIARLPDISGCRPILEQLANERAVSRS